MKDRYNTQVYVGDVLRIMHNRLNPYGLDMPEMFIGKVIESETIKTGYGSGGFVVIEYPNGYKERIANSKLVYRLPDAEAMLWRLENS